MDDSILNPMSPPANQLNRTDFDGPVAILWDIENCPVPSDVCPENVAGNIRMALRVHPVVNGAVMSFSAFGDFNAFPRRLREGCQRTGVRLVDVPNGRKDAADKAILVEMFLFALDNPSPSTIMLISGDVDFAPALHILGQRGYTIILVIPSGVRVSSALCNAGKFVWDWPSVARGEGFLSPGKASMPPRDCGAADISGYFAGCYINETQSGQNEEAIVYQGISHSLSELNSGVISMPSFPTTTRSHSLPSGLNEVNEGFASSSDQNDPTSYVQPGDPNGLKGQLVKILVLSGGRLPLTEIPNEYQKIFGRPLCLSEYGESKLVDLLSKMNDAIAVVEKGQKKFVYLWSWKDPNDLKGQLVKLLVLSGGRLPLTEIPNEYQKIFGQPLCLSEYGESKLVDLLSKMNDAIAVVEKGQKKFVYLWSWKDPNGLKGQLVKLLVLSGGRLPLNEIPNEYQKIFGQPLCLSDYGESKLVDLLSKMNDAIAVVEKGQKKFVYLWSWKDPNGLKGQLVKLLVLSGGRLPLTEIPNEYQKIFGQPLCLLEYGASKLVDLLRKMNDVIAVVEKGQKKFVYLRRKGKKGRGPLEDSGDLMTGCCNSLDECLDGDQLQTEERGNKSDDQSLQEFKYELQGILASYSCQIFLDCFETFYEQQYKRPLDYRRLGVKGVEELFEKMRDVVNVHEDLISKRKSISAICGLGEW